MKILSWNVNSVLARLERLKKVLTKHDPDIVFLQELKCVEEKYPFDAIREMGYESYVSGQKAYNGVAILAKNKIKLENVFKALYEEARFISAQYKNCTLINVYVPNGQEVDSPKYFYKLDWFKQLNTHLSKTLKNSHVVIGGDFNVAPDERDVYDPKAWQGRIHFSEKERKAIQDLYELGLMDSFRIHHEEGGHYSWWDYRTLGFIKNHGLRIDYILVNKDLVSKCKSVMMDREERKGEKPSDHVPVICEIEL